jgi:hypothetical protein
MGDAPPARTQALDRKCEKTVGGDPAPLGIIRGEMNADIPIAERAQDGIDKGMQNHIGIGMPRQTALVRNAHAPKHDVIAVAE